MELWTKAPAARTDLLKSLPGPPDFDTNDPGHNLIQEKLGERNEQDISARARNAVINPSKFEEWFYHSIFTTHMQNKTDEKSQREWETPPLGRR